MKVKHIPTNEIGTIQIKKSTFLAMKLLQKQSHAYVYVTLTLECDKKMQVNIKELELA